MNINKLDINQLPTLNTVALKLTALLQQDINHIDVETMVGTLQYDQALSLRILRIANSPAYGFVRQITTLKDAINLIGLKPTATLALSFILVDTWAGYKPKSLNYTLFWRRSILSALAGREIAKYLIKDQTETVFMSALLQDIGILIFAQLYSQDYAHTISSFQEVHLTLARVERRTFTIDHARLGASVLEKLYLPETICDAVANSHQTQSSTDSVLNDCVAASGWFADIWLHGSVNPYNKLLALELAERLLPPLNPDQIDIVIHNTNQATSDIRDLFPHIDLPCLSNDQLIEVQQTAKQLQAMYRKSIFHDKS